MARNITVTNQAVLIPSAKPTIRFIKVSEVKTVTGISQSEIYRRMAAGTFPKQVTLGPKCVVWIEAEVLAWCDERIAESRGEAA
ncbi:AlpA family transcriptional regulator [Pseudomonas sp. Irchel s3a18]|uniref:helix-turn-helix transcriptional regulator n=1 Tax=Pseudomonas sp. Irchel s3a18 TaxID=2009053 RepID=UPI000BA2FB78|nr:AlpA family transcriptional regulator [Pseudomonas sp. Irchel s3a18]